jgi:hypothetical protein
VLENDEIRDPIEIDFMPVQPEKHRELTVLIESGSQRVVKPTQYLKQYTPSEFTEFPSETFTNEEQD